MMLSDDEWLDAENARESMLLAWIRATCAREFECERDTPFFHLDSLEGESADATILRLFYAQRAADRETDPAVTDLSVLVTLIHG